MPADLIKKLYEDLDPEQLRFSHPSRFIFFCGGATSQDANDACSLRHYLLNERDIAPRLNAKIVLAEGANQLYRDSKYRDLISFEEDIAKISTMILLVAESAGSLAELGAFSANEATKKSLVVLMQERYSKAESFVRFGPIERIIIEDDERVGFFPWEEDGQRKIVKPSAEPHIENIEKLINGLLSKVPKAALLSRNPEIADFIILYWIIFLSLAIPVQKLVLYASEIVKDSEQSSIRKKLFCMELAGWIGRKRYSNKDYHYCKIDVDPFDYAFLPGVTDNQSIRRKSLIASEIQKDLSLPDHVREFAALERQQP